MWLNPKVESPRRRLSRAERREQLLACAVKAYANLGVERAGHGDVAKLAGVSTATVFNYFATREILTQAVLDCIRERFLNMFDTFPKNDMPAADQIKNLAAQYKTFTDSQAIVVKVMLNWSVSFGPDTRPQFLSFQSELLDRLSERISGQKKDRSDARLLSAAAFMFARMKLDNTDEDTINRFIERVAGALA